MHYKNKRAFFLGHDSCTVSTCHRTNCTSNVMPGLQSLVCDSLWKVSLVEFGLGRCFSILHVEYQRRFRDLDEVVIAANK